MTKGAEERNEGEKCGKGDKEDMNSKYGVPGEERGWKGRDRVQGGGHR